MSIKTYEPASLSLRQLIAAMPIMTRWHNSKGRIMPLHLRSAPGQGKTMIAVQAANSMARAKPGTPIGISVCTPSVMSPADVAGFVLFDSLKEVSPDFDGRMVERTTRVSTYTRPTIFAAQRAIIYSADTDSFESVRYDDFGQTLYVGSMVRGQRLDHGVMLLDEFDQADAEVRKALAPLLDEGRITTHHLPLGWMVWAASNRAKDASGVGRGLAFLTNRVTNIELDRDPDAFGAYLNGRSITDSVVPMSLSMEVDYDEDGRVLRDPNDYDYSAHPVVLSFARSQEDKLYAGVPADPNEPFLTPRSLEVVSNLFDVMLRLPVADDTGAMPATTQPRETFINRERDEDSAERWRVFTSLASGVIGVDNARQLAAMVDMYGEIPALADIIRDPKKAHVPEKMDAQYLVGFEVSKSMRRDNIEALNTYAKRLAPHFYDSIVMNALDRDGELVQAPCLSTYFRDNAHIMIRMLTMNEQRKTRERKVSA
jgi:hypothetical protein